MFDDQLKMQGTEIAGPSQEELQRMIIDAMMKFRQADPSAGPEQYAQAQKFLQAAHEQFMKNPSMAGALVQKADGMLGALAKPGQATPMSPGSNGPATMGRESERERIGRDLGPYFPFSAGNTPSGSRNEDANRPYLNKFQGTLMGSLSAEDGETTVGPYVAPQGAMRLDDINLPNSSGEIDPRLMEALKMLLQKRGQ